MLDKKIALTGIKPTGKPHIGNYLGAIKPALSLLDTYQGYYFIADYHALTTVRDPKVLRKDMYDVAATWLALGLDPSQVMFYRQSDIPEIFELAWVLSCLASKGLLNRAHAYKSLVDENLLNKKDPDKGINTGLYNYPVLMASDILTFDCHIVPVGLDQKQHVEIARDIALAFNHHYGDVFVVPEPLIQESVQTIIGIDGRKMSKQYNNTIPLFEEAGRLRKSVMKIVTDSTAVDEPKDPSKCNVFQLYRCLASEEDSVRLGERYRAGGMGYGDAKVALFDLLQSLFSDAKKRYDLLMADTSQIDHILDQGKEKARQKATEKLVAVRRAIGITA